VTRDDTTTRSAAWRLLEQVPDPELPTMSVVDLGIVRDVAETAQRSIVVTITPTYSGCPATEVIAQDIRAALEAEYDDVQIRTQLSPAWTTDWLSDEAKGKLENSGIAPPQGRTSLLVLDSGAPTACPQCGSTDTEETSRFGPTPCMALWRCVTCREPFEYMKCH
jgi:ring-1,2-phenylacetyl-CoA epoxidase subunit PaaD